MRIKSISINTVMPTPRDIQTEALPINNELNPSIIAIAKRDTIPTCEGMRQFFRLFQQSSKSKLTARILEDGPAGIDLAAPLLVGHPLEFSPLLLAVVRSEERIGPEGLGAVLLQFV